MNAPLDLPAKLKANGHYTLFDKQSVSVNSHFDEF